MHVYIFDYFLGQKKYERIVAKLETRLTDLGLQGKNCHVGPLKSLRSIVKDELRNNPKTMVAIGNDATFSGLINALGGVDTTVGVVPVGRDNALAALCGITDEDAACAVLSARLIERVDVGTINNYRFISRAVIQNSGSIMEINGRYTVEPAAPGDITIVNLTTNRRPGVDLRRGSLGVSVSAQKKSLFSGNPAPASTFIQTNRVIANNFINKSFVIDNALEVKTPAVFGVEKKALSIIVGKERKF